MNKQHFIILSLISYIFLSGFLFEERGMSLPAPEKKSNATTPSVKDDFPLIKIKAFPTDGKHIKSKVKLEKQKIEIQNDSTLKAPESLFDTIMGIFKFNSKQEDTKKPKNPNNRIKKHTKTQNEEIKPIQISTKYKTKEKRAKRRQTGHFHKLIFNKNTSLKDIPLPLPNLKSLKLKSLIKSIPTIPVSKVPILSSIIPDGSKVARRRLKSQRNTINNTSTDNTKNTAARLDMANIRIAKSNDYTTLIFDSYQWSGYNQESTQVAKESGNYNFEYEPKRNRIVATIHGYTSFSALLGDQSQLFKNSDVIKNIYIDRYIGDDSIKFIIQIKKPIQMTVQNMKNPGRIILNLYPQ